MNDTFNQEFRKMANDLIEGNGARERASSERLFFYKVENSSTSSLKRCNALSIGSGVVKSTPAFSVDLMDNLNFHL